MTLKYYKEAKVKIIKLLMTEKDYFKIKDFNLE